MPGIETILLIIALLLLISVFASKLSTKLSVPALAIFLLIGMLAGSEGVGGIYFDDPLAAQSLGVVALIFILFAGGFDTPIAETQPVLLRGLLLSTLGVLITAGVVTVSVMLLLDSPLEEAFLLGAIVSATDAAAVFSILGTQKIALKGNTVPLLELESGSNDPMAIFLTISAIEIIQQPEASIGSLALLFVQQMALGGLFGFAMGYSGTKVINMLRLEADGLYSVFTVGMVLLTFAVTASLGGSGFLAVYILGLILSSQNFIHKNSLARFHDGLSWLMQIVMFITLGLLVFPSRLLPVATVGVLIALILIFVARPASIFIALMFSQFDMRDKLMISWVGLRGATPIVLAIFPLLAGIPNSDEIFNVVFFVVLVSILLQGSTLITIAKWLNLTVPFIPKPQYPFELVNDKDLRSKLEEIKIAADSAAIDRQIVNLGLPESSLIVLVARGQEIIVPNGNTIIQAGDILFVLGDAQTIDSMRQALNSV